MIDKFLQYIDLSFRDIPTSLFVGMLLLFLAGAAFLLYYYGFKKGMRWSALLLLFEYLFLLISLTLLFREIPTERRINVFPFWSYRAVWGRGNEPLLTQMIMNVFAFIPVGFLLGISFPNIKWWKVLLIGGTFSLLIETTQFVFKRGFAEFDDVFHNVLGCMIGWGVYLAFVSLAKKMKNHESLSH